MVSITLGRFDAMDMSKNQHSFFLIYRYDRHRYLKEYSLILELQDLLPLSGMSFKYRFGHCSQKYRLIPRFDGPNGWKLIYFQVAACRKDKVIAAMIAESNKYLIHLFQFLNVKATQCV